MKNITHIFLVSLALLVLAGCSPSDEPADPTRVLVVYMGADSNLSGFEREKLEGLQAGWTGKPSDKIIAYVDNRRDGAALYDLNTEMTLLASYGAEDSASPEVFARVINDIINKYEADQYGLLVFSHASGWLPGGSLLNPRIAPSVEGFSIITDGTNEMELKDLAEAIPDDVFEYIVFETCFMAGIEVAYELRNKAPHILASSAEIVHPGYAPVYANATKYLFSNDLRSFGQSVFEYIESYGKDDARCSSTLSLISTAGLEELASFVRDNCELGREVEISDIQHFDRYNYRLFFDFEDYCSRLLDTDAQRAELSRLIVDCVPWKGSTDTFMTQSASYNGFVIERHSGFTSYIPQNNFSELNDAYRKLSWSKHIGL